MPFTKAKARKIVKEVIMPKLPKHPGKIRKLAKAIEAELEVHKKVTDLIKRAKGMNEADLKWEINRIKDDISETRKDLAKQYGAPIAIGSLAGYELNKGILSASPVVTALYGLIVGGTLTMGGALISTSFARGKTSEILREQKERKEKLKTLNDLIKLSPEEIDELIKIREEREKAVEKIIEAMRKEAEELERKRAKKKAKRKFS